MSETKNLDGKLQGILIKGYTTLLADLGMPYGEATPKIVSRRVKETEAQIKELSDQKKQPLLNRITELEEELQTLKDLENLKKQVD